MIVQSINILNILCYFDSDVDSDYVSPPPSVKTPTPPPHHNNLGSQDTNPDQESVYDNISPQNAQSTSHYTQSRGPGLHREATFASRNSPNLNSEATFTSGSSHRINSDSSFASRNSHRPNLEANFGSRSSPGLNSDRAYHTSHYSTNSPHQQHRPSAYSSRSYSGTTSNSTSSHHYIPRSYTSRSYVDSPLHSCNGPSSDSGYRYSPTSELGRTSSYRRASFSSVSNGTSSGSAANLRYQPTSSIRSSASASNHHHPTMRSSSRVKYVPSYKSTIRIDTQRY